jgi:hypothetical protein
VVIGQTPVVALAVAPLQYHCFASIYYRRPASLSSPFTPNSIAAPAVFYWAAGLLLPEKLEKLAVWEHLKASESLKIG